MTWINLEKALSDAVIETFGEPMRLQGGTAPTSQPIALESPDAVGVYFITAEGEMLVHGTASGGGDGVIDVEFDGVLDRGYQPQPAAGERMARYEIRATIPEQESTALVGARLTARGVQYRVSRVQDNLDGTFVLDLGKQS